MGLSSQVNRVDAIGNGTTNAYDFTFRVFQNSNINVIVKDADGITTNLTEGTHYTVTGGTTDNGGTITLIAGDFSWLDGSNFLETSATITIRRVLPLTQLSDIRNQGSFFPEIHEDQFDKLVMIAQQLDEELSRTIRVPEEISSENFSTELPTTLTPDYYVKVNSAGDGLELATAFSTDVTIGSGTGVVCKTSASASVVRTLADETGEIHIAEPLGLSGNPTFRIPTLNLGLACSVGSSALTIALKQKDGTTDPSTSAPVAFPMRDDTSANGVVHLREVTSALSLTISSGSTLGHASGATEYIHVYAIDTDGTGTIELGASTTFFRDGSVQNINAEGGSGGADNSTRIYANTGASSRPIFYIGSLKSVQTTAGTWAAVPSEISIRQTTGKPPTQQIFTSSGTWTRPEGCVAIRVWVCGGGGGAGGIGATGTGSVGFGTGGAGGCAGMSLLLSGFGASETVTIGAGGAGGVGGASGSNGGTTSFGSLVTADGGNAGANSTIVSSITSAVGPSGGDGGTHDVRFVGGDGGSGWATGSVTGIEVAVSGYGGSSFFSGGTRHYIRAGSAVSGDDANGYGVGGSGPSSGPSNNSAANGGDGSDGLVIVEEFYL